MRKSSNNAALTLSDGAVLQESYQVVFNTANPNSKRTLHAGPLKMIYVFNGIHEQGRIQHLSFFFFLVLTLQNNVPYFHMFIYLKKIKEQ